MRHPEALLLPVLMFLDYFLTVLGAVIRAKKHAHHFKLEHYELNPVWQKAIAGKKWFNLRHLIITTFASGYLYWFSNYCDAPDQIINPLIGALIGLFGMIVGRHISNLLIFSYYIRHPDMISGEVVLSHPLALATSAFQYFTVLVPMALIAFCSGSSYVYGAVGGIIISLFTHYFWLIKARHQSPRS